MYLHLTKEVVAPYKGGQLEIQNQNEGYVFRGEIKDVQIEDCTLKVEFVWLGEASFPPVSWKKSGRLDYSVPLELCTAGHIGNDRIAVSSFITGELAVFYPQGSSRLDPVRVEGLELTV